MKTTVKATFLTLIAAVLFAGTSFGQALCVNPVQKYVGPQYGAPQDSAKVVRELSMYREFYRQNNYKDALPHWRYVFKTAPAASHNMYLDGIRMYTKQIAEAKDAAVREKLVDSLILIYNQRLANFGTDPKMVGDVYSRMGIELLQYRPNDLENIYPYFAESVRLLGNESENYSVIYYFRTTVGMVKELNKLPNDAMFDAYEQVSEIIDFNLNKYENDEKALADWQNAKANVDAIFEPYATCTELLPMYQKKYDETPNDIKLLKKITNMLERKNCRDSDLFFAATEALHKADPNAQSAYMMGLMYYQKEDMGMVQKYMEEAAGLFTNAGDKVKALQVIMAIQASNRQFGAAQGTAGRILQIRPNDGKAHMMIADYYAMMAASCTEDGLGGRSAYWAAVDRLQRARSADASVEAEAGRKIAQYSRHFPKSEDLFFLNISEGSSFRVPCLGVSTTVRGIK